MVKPMSFHPSWECDRKGKSIGTLNLANHLALILMDKIRNVNMGETIRALLFYYTIV